MKLKLILVGTVAVFSLTSLCARAEQTLYCTNGGDEVHLYSTSGTEFIAKVKVELFGGAVESHTYRRIMILPPSRIPGAPLTYKGPGFKLSVYSEQRVRATMEVPALVGDQAIDLDTCQR